MKTLLKIVLLSVVCLGTLPLYAASGRRARKAEARLERIGRECDSLALAANHLLWGYYIDLCERTDREIPLTLLGVSDAAKLCDTVPGLEPYQDAYKAAYAKYEEFLKADPEYEAIRQEKESLRGIDDKALRNANRQRYNLLYLRVREADPEHYVPVRDTMNKLYRQRNAAIARYLLFDAERQGVQMPSLAGYTYKEERTAILSEHPELADMQARVQLLRQLRSELRERILREEYGVPKEPVSGGKPWTHVGAVTE